MRIGGEAGRSLSIGQPCAYDSVSPAFLLRAQCSNGCAHQIVDTGLTFRILERQGTCDAITCQSLLLSAKFGIEVAARQLKQWIRRVLFYERAADIERRLILLIVTMQIQREIKARDV